MGAGKERFLRGQRVLLSRRRRVAMRRRFVSLRWLGRVYRARASEFESLLSLSLSFFFILVFVVCAAWKIARCIGGFFFAANGNWFVVKAWVVAGLVGDVY